MTTLAAPAEPTTQATYRCAWCKCEGTDEEIKKIPRTTTWLCADCWRWYCGVGKRREMCGKERDGQSSPLLHEGGQTESQTHSAPGNATAELVVSRR